MYRFGLEKKTGKRKYDCPKCGAKKRFTRYVDTASGEYIADDVGRCDREDGCGYHRTPKQFFEEHKHLHTTQRIQAFSLETIKAVSPSFIPSAVYRQSLKCYEYNNFALYLIALFGDTVARKLLQEYNVGTSRHRPGATVFWQVDVNGRVRTAKIMQYEANTGKRSKDPYHHITWAHRLLKMPDFHLLQCLFGEHLLPLFPTKPVAVVESEKTAIIASVYHPEYIWLACGGINGISKERMAVLKGRNIVLYPDLGAYEKWKLKSKAITTPASVEVSSILEQYATEAEQAEGLDIADFLLLRDKETGLALKNGYPVIWDYKFNQLM